MCLEFLFAFLYFFILLIINFFLVKIIKDCFLKIIQLLKFKKSFTLIDLKNSGIIPFFYYYFEKNSNFQKQETTLFSKKIVGDILIIGNAYKYLQQKKKLENSIFYYINLQENQYLNNK